MWLDRGNAEDWLQSNFIILLIITSTVSLFYFVYRGIKRTNNIVDLSLFTDRNFNYCLVLVLLYCLGFISMVALQPLMVESLMGYSAYQAGLLLAPRGIASAIAMLLAASLMKYWDSRLVVAVGILLSALGSFLMTGFSLQSSFESMLWPSLIQGLGLGLFFVPMTTCAFLTLPEHQVANASGIYSFGRSLGSAIGISLLSTVVTREAQINWHQLGNHLSANNPSLHHWLAQLHLTLNEPSAIPLLVTQLAKHAMMIAYLDAFWLTTLGYLAILPLVFFIKIDTASGARRHP